MVECAQDQVQNQSLAQLKVTQYGEMILNEITNIFSKTLAQ